MVRDFENVSEFIRYLENNRHINPDSKTLTSKSDWSGVSSWEQFEEYLDNGNPDITDEVRKQSKYYIDKFEEMFVETSQYQFDVVGEFFDIGAVMVGEPEAWIKEIKVKDEKFIELNIQGTYQDGTDLAMVRKNASKVFAIASVLEMKGFLVKINMIYSSLKSNVKKPSEVSTVTIKVKGYDQTLDYKKFGILLGTPMFRRGYLRLLEIEFGEYCKPSYGIANSQSGWINLNRTSEVDKLELMLKNKE
jgi:hypothetical protein